MISLQTNVDSLVAQDNLNINSQFQSKTIQQLTSGYRINSSADDAAGLAVANGYRDNIAELRQGVSNANDGVSQLQIVDGGLSNISTMLDRMQTLATESASGTFTGNRSTLNQEYQQLITEISRQASNVNLNSGGSFNTNLNVYIGGASTASNAGVTVNLSGSQNAVDATSLGLSTTNVLAGGVGISGNSLRIDAPGATFGTSQAFTFNVYANGASTQVVANSGTGSLTSVLGNLNTALNAYGITAGVDGNGKLQFSGATAFTASAGTGSLTSGTGTAENTSNYIVDGGTGANQFVTPTGNETLNFQTSAGSTTVTLGTSITTVSAAAAAINAKTAQLGVYAVVNSAGDGLSFQSANSFSLADTPNAAGEGIFGAGAAAGTTNNTSTAPTTGDSTNAQAAISAIGAAIQALGQVQGNVGAGENKLQYAISLAQSQISNFSAAESQIRDANVASDAANLTKSQVLVQTSVAAMAQANAEPQAVLKLLQG
jgi:flagellin